MARGELKGTFYVPDVPTYVDQLDIHLGEHGEALVRKMHEMYPVKFAEAVFCSVNERVEYNVDRFVRKEAVNPSKNPILMKQGELPASCFKCDLKCSLR